MRAILGIKRTLVEQPQVGLVDQSRALQGVSRTLPLEMMPGDVAEFLVDQRNQRFKGFLVARLPAHEQFADRLGMLLIHSQLRPETQYDKDSFPPPSQSM